MTLIHASAANNREFVALLEATENEHAETLYAKNMKWLSCGTLSKRLLDLLSDKWVPVTTAWRVLRLRMEERPPIRRVAANKPNKQSRTADKGWSSSMVVGWPANNSSPYKDNHVTSRS